MFQMGKMYLLRSPDERPLSGIPVLDKPRLHGDVQNLPFARAKLGDAFGTSPKLGSFTTLRGQTQSA